MFITFEGGEGTGKSTQVRLLGIELAEAGISAVLTREPGGTDQAERIRDLLVRGDSAFDPMTEALLLCAARREHVTRKIRPALDAGQWVVCDRFADSTRAMQGRGLGLDMDVIEALHALVVGDLVPDLTFVFDIDPAAGLQRSQKRLREQKSAETRYERMDIGFHERLRAGFLEIAANNPARCVVIDAAQSESAVAAQVRDTVAARGGISFRKASHG